MKNFYLFLIGFMMCGVINAQDTPPDGTPVIKLTTTTAGATVRINMRAAAANTPAWIETAPNTYTQVTVGTSWTGHTNYTPTDTSLKVYGSIIGFNCDGVSTGDRNPVSALDASENTSLQTLYCNNNQLASLNVQGLTQLNTLWCYNNQLQSLNVQGLTQLNTLWCEYNQLQSLNVQDLTQLQGLWCNGNQLQSLNVQGLTQLNDLRCYNNQLTSLDVHGLTQLEMLFCYNNQLTSLNLHGLTQLKCLDCSDNQLTSLDVQGLTQLKTLYCYDNPCTSTTLGLDQLYCQLPERQEADGAKIYVSVQAQANLEAFVLATNGDNANSKNWKLFNTSGYEITNTTGTYVCGTLVPAIVTKAFSIYPNPTGNIINIVTENVNELITIIDLFGRTVMTAITTDTKTILDIRHLAAGTYIIRVGNKIKKIVKN